MIAGDSVADRTPPSQSRGSTDRALEVAAPSERLRARLLMVSMIVPPTPSGSAYVVKNLLAHMDSGEVVVAAERNPENAASQVLEPGGHRVHFSSTAWTWPQRGRRFLHWPKWALLPRTVHRLCRLARREKCEAIFANFPNEYFLCAAYLASRRLGLPLFAYFHNTYGENRRGIARRFANWLQPRVFRRAKRLFVMSAGMAEELERRHPGVRFEPLVHTFEGEVPEFEPLARPSAPIRLGFLGSLNESNLDAMRRFCAVVDSTPSLTLNIYTGVTGWFMKKSGIVGRGIAYQQPSDDELTAALQSNDILLMPHGLTGGRASIEYATIFPTRTIPYLLAGRPILAHVPEDSFFTRWLRRHDCAEIVSEPSVDAVRDAILNLANNEKRREQLVRNGLAAVRQFQASQVVGRMKRSINEALAPSQ